MGDIAREQFDQTRQRVGTLEWSHRHIAVHLDLDESRTADGRRWLNIVVRESDEVLLSVTQEQAAQLRTLVDQFLAGAP